MSEKRIEYRVCHPTETSLATQVVLDGDVLGLYWHFPDGFQRTGSQKRYPDETSARRSILRSSIRSLSAQLAAIKSELLNLNQP